MCRLCFALLSLSFLTACQPGVAPLTEEDIAALEATEAVSAEATLAGDCDAASALFAEDAVLMPQDAPSLVGMAAIKADCEAGGPAPQEASNTSLGWDGYGDLAVGHGTWAQSFVMEEATVMMSGKYVLVARKQADGSWLWTKVIWNSDAPLPEPTEEG